jgi:hypothetical protein
MDFGMDSRKSFFASGFIISWDVWTRYPAGFLHGSHAGLMAWQEKSRRVSVIN